MAVSALDFAQEEIAELKQAPRQKLRFAFWGPRRWAYYGHHGYGYSGRENEAYHILRERYARGEITKDQYDAMMRDLYQQPPKQTPPRY